MFEAGALLLALFASWMLLTPHLSVTNFEAGVLASLICVAIASRLPKTGKDLFVRIPQLAMARAATVAGTFQSAMTVARSAIAADVKLKPALVRVRTRLRTSSGVATFASIIGSAVGGVVIVVDDDGLLVHVNDERGDNMRDIKHWEGMAGAAVGERPAP